MFPSFPPPWLSVFRFIPGRLISPIFPEFSCFFWILSRILRTQVSVSVGVVYSVLGLRGGIQLTLFADAWYRKNDDVGSVKAHREQPKWWVSSNTNGCSTLHLMGYKVDYLDPCVGKFILIRFGEPFSYFLKMSILALGLNMNSGIRICSHFFAGPQWVRPHCKWCC